MDKANLFQQLVHKCDKHVEHYRDDLLVHDFNWIDGNYPTPFLHFSRECGTHLISMEGIGQLPPKGQHIRYCFGMSDREHIAHDTVKTVRYLCSGVEPCSQILHFDGESLHTVTKDRANVIVNDWHIDLRHKFLEEVECEEQQV